MGTPGIPFNKTEDEILDAIIKGEGVVTRICQLLDCSYQTFYNIHKQDEDIQKALKAARNCFDEKLLDLSEHALTRALSAKDDMNSSLRASFYVLNNKGKKRGYCHAPAGPSAIPVQDLIDTLKNPPNVQDKTSEPKAEGEPMSSDEAD